MSGVRALVPDLSRLTLTLFFLSWGWTAYAQEFSVNTFVDTVDKDLSDGICADVDDKCSLRAAVMQANQLAGENHVIYLPVGLYTLSIKGPAEHYARTGDLDIRGNITITSVVSDPNRTIVDGGGIDRVFEVVGPGHATFRFITIRNGSALNNYFNYANGGGIGVTGGGRSVNGETTSLLVEHCIIRDNRAVSGGGIDIALSGGTIRDTSIINNSVRDSGGGVSANVAASVFIANSTISGNKANQSGGGVITSNLGIILNNVTITGNIADADNDGDGAGGGIASYYNRQNFAANSLIAGNADLSGSAPDCSVIGFTSMGHNLIGDATGCVFDATDGDQVGAPSSPLNPLLAPLANNGGPTPTHALLPKSPAIDAGNPAPPGSGGYACEATDQRGVARRGRCDIGAFESGTPATATGATNNSGTVGNPFGGNTESAQTDHGTVDPARNPFLSETQATPVDTQTPDAQLRRSRPLETPVHARGGGRGGDEESREDASALSRLLEHPGLNEGTANSGWPTAGSIDNERPWLTIASIEDPNAGIASKAVMVTAGVVFVAGAIGVYVHSGTLLGWIFSFPLWGSVDPIHVLMVSNAERRRRKDEVRRERQKEDHVDRVGRYFES